VFSFPRGYAEGSSKVSFSSAPAENYPRQARAAFVMQIYDFIKFSLLLCAEKNINHQPVNLLLGSSAPESNFSSCSITSSITISFPGCHCCWLRHVFLIDSRLPLKKLKQLYKCHCHCYHHHRHRSKE
jgi:hypothetical protein